MEGQSRKCLRCGAALNGSAKMSISETVLQRFWASAGLDQYEAQDLIDRLVEWSLAQRDE